MKFGFVTPRYGGEIGSGPEHACRLLAEQLGERHAVEVITTCARDDRTWANDYSEGADRVRGVVVRRFPVSQPHDRAAFGQLTERLLSTPGSRDDELEWVRRLGPWTPSLIDYLKRQGRTYDALVFFSLYHPTTVHGLAAAPERSLLFPHLQLRPALRFSLWPDVLSSAAAIGWLSETERRLARAYLGTTCRDEVVGIGVDPTPQQTYPRHQQNPADAVVADEDAPADVEVVEEAPLDGRGVPFRRRHRLYGPFALYGGPVETDNGCEEMLEYFDAYASGNGDTALVLMGVKMLRMPAERAVRLAGVLPDRERMIAYAAADVTLAPNPDDLLAQSVIESMAVGTPVLASARNDAAVEHCRRSNAGLYYANRGEFVEALRLIMTNADLRQRLGENGRQYVQREFRWDAVRSRFDRLVGRLRST